MAKKSTRKTDTTTRQRFDAIDRAILRELQDNARITNTTLAERVGISPPSTLERVKKLERKGVITGYVALLDAPAVGRSVLAIVHVSIKEHSAAALQQTRTKLSSFDEVQACWYCAGEEDFILKVRVSDMEGYERFVSRKLATVAGIGRLRTSFVLSTIKDTPCIALEMVEDAP
ncbi:MAG: Lrp/AsnC family transcriptional regulator [Phycisphaerales bacterium]